MDTSPTDPHQSSGWRRRVIRVAAALPVVVALRNGEKRPARVIDLSVGGMHLQSEHVPGYGEPITVIVRLRDSDDWSFLPATVRWFSRQGFGVAFESLDAAQARALAAYVDQFAA